MDSRILSHRNNNDNQIIRGAHSFNELICTNKFGHSDSMHHEYNFMNVSPQCSTIDTNDLILSNSRIQFTNFKSFESQISQDGNNNTPSTTDADSSSIKDCNETFPLSIAKCKRNSCDLIEDSLLRNELSYAREKNNLSVPRGDHYESKLLNNSTTIIGKQDHLLNQTNGSIMDETLARVSECVVCGDKSSGKHYGQYTCEGCKSFFKRSVRRELSYSCRGSRSCRVDMQHRNQCQYCRYQKCLKMGMRKEAVQRGRIPSDGFTSYVSLPSYTSGLSPASWPEIYSHSTPNSNNSQQTQRSNVSCTNSALLTMILKAENSTTLSLSSSENVTDNACQILLSVVEWARRIPHFLELHLADSMTLLTNSWHELYLMNFLQLGLSNSLYNLGLNTNIFLDSMQTRLVQDQLERFSKTNLDPMEFACLKCLILFNPDSVGLSEITLVESIQERIQLALEEHIHVTYPGQTNRLSRLLLRLPAFRAFPPHFIEQLFFSRQLSNGKGTVETLIRDILLGYSTQIPASIYSSGHTTAGGGGGGIANPPQIMTHQPVHQLSHSWCPNYSTVQSHASLPSGES